jgi:phosphatidylglycerol:prolipoprotein diacylglycerol transferase
MFPVLHVGRVALQTPDLLILLGIWVGVMLIEKFAERFSISTKQLENLTLWSLLSGLVGARLLYFLKFPQAFLANPLDILSLRPFLLDFEGGVTVALIVALIYGQKRKMSFWSTLDALTPGFAVFAVSLGLAHLASGNAYGIETRLPWGIELWGAVRHPVQIYETLAAMLILYLVLPLKFRQETIERQKRGVLFLKFVALSAAANLLLDTFRAEGIRWFGVVRAGQVTAWLVLALSLWLIGRRQQTETENPANLL